MENINTRFSPYNIDDLGAEIALRSLPVILGDWYHVNPNTVRNSNTNPYPGDNSKDGLTKETPLANLKNAYDKCYSGRGDGIVLYSSGLNTAGCTSYLGAALDWTKWGITVVGVCAPTVFGQRARISTKEEDLAYLIDVQGSNNAFYNISMFNGGTTGAGGLKVSGQRNYFGRMNIMGGMGMSTPTINDYSLLLDGADENTFEKCIIGNDTFDKDDIAGAELIVQNGCMRNHFNDCEFLSYRTAGTTAGMIKTVNTNCITRELVFKDCLFNMYRDGAVPAEVSVWIGTVPNNGFVIFRGDCVKLGFTDFSAAGTARSIVTMPTSVNATSGGVLDNPS